MAEGLRALDRYTFQIRLKQPNYNFLYYLAYCNLTCAVAREVVEHYGDRIAEHPVGTGPFRLAFWKRSSKMVFEPNPNYREELLRRHARRRTTRPGSSSSRACKGKRLPMVDKVEVYMIEEPQPRWLAFLNDEHRLPRARAQRVRQRRHAQQRARAQPEEARRAHGAHAGHGAHLLVLRDEGPGGGRLRAGEGRAAPRHRARPGRRRRDPHRRARTRRSPRTSPIGPGAMGYDPDFRSTATEYNPAKVQGAPRHVRLRRTATATAGATCRGRTATASASPSPSSTPRRPRPRRSRSTRTGRRTWTPSAST